MLCVAAGHQVKGHISLTRAALLGACIGTIAYGMLARRIYHSITALDFKEVRGRKEEDGLVCILIRGPTYIQYLIMLVVMTFSGPLCISVIVGLVSGHVAFHWKQVTCPNV